jgi:hypothetical protein
MIVLAVIQIVYPLLKAALFLWFIFGAITPKEAARVSKCRDVKPTLFRVIGILGVAWIISGLLTSGRSPYSFSRDDLKIANALKALFAGGTLGMLVAVLIIDGVAKIRVKMELPPYYVFLVRTGAVVLFVGLLFAAQRRSTDSFVRETYLHISMVLLGLGLALFGISLYEKTSETPSAGTPR